MALPTVNTLNPDNVYATSARLWGESTSTGGHIFTEWGFAYTKASPVNWQYVCFYGSRAYTFTWSGGVSTTPLTDYMFRAYATTDSGTGWGALVEFATPELNTTIVVPSGLGAGRSISPDIIIGTNVTTSVPYLEGVAGLMPPTIVLETPVAAPTSQGRASLTPPEVETLSVRILEMAFSIGRAGLSIENVGVCREGLHIRFLGASKAGLQEKVRVGIRKEY